MIDAVAREPHFFRHLAPTWEALAPERRGTFFVHERMVEECSARFPVSPVTEIPDGGPVTVVASYRDLKLARQHGRYVVVSEHGAGQTYQKVESGSYLAGPDRAGVVALLVPSLRAARIAGRTHPTIPAYPVGVPYLDQFHGRQWREIPARPTVALSFHWNCQLAPEARGCHRFYRRAFPSLTADFDILGHGHPRIIRRIEPVYKRAGIEVVEDFFEVIERADIYACDNSSTIYEWAALDKPVVVLNSPTYRRNVEHGLRFWEYADVGVQADGPSELPDAIKRASADPPEVARRRREIAAAVYGTLDGGSAERAADYLAGVADQWG